MKLFTRKITALFLMLVILCSLILSASAFGGEDTIAPFASGNGYTSTNITLNGYSYLCTASASCDSSNRGFTGLSTQANCTRTHGRVTLRYLSTNEGYVPCYSNYKGAVTCSGASISDYAVPGSNFKAISSVTGTITVTVTQLGGRQDTYTFNPLLNNG